MHSARFNIRLNAFEVCLLFFYRNACKIAPEKSNLHFAPCRNSKQMSINFAHNFLHRWSAFRASYPVLIAKNALVRTSFLGNKDRDGVVA
jgi:hypothetical protein